MRKNIGLLCLAMAAIANADTCVWRVERGGECLYIGGTCHCLSEKDYPLPAPFTEAYSNSAAIYLECDLREMRAPEAEKKYREVSFYSDGTTLKDHLKPETWAALGAYCASNGIPAEQFARMKPAAAMLAMTYGELRKLGIDPANGVETHFIGLAAKDGKRVAGLETVAKQLGYLENIDGGKPDAFMRYSLEDAAKAGRQFREIVAAWRAGDAKALDAIVRGEMQEEFKPLYKTLVLDRNETWIPRIEALLATPEREFVLVGAGHLVGSGSVLELLQKRGCKISRVSGR